MNTPSTDDGARIGSRKAHHLDICLNAAQYRVEHEQTAFFEQLGFVHQPLPELDTTAINTQTGFLGHTLKLPFMISCMTGGSGEGRRANHLLAAAAQTLGIPVGLGSIRVLFHDASRLEDFSIKHIAPDVPVLANLGAVQVRDLAPAVIEEMLRRLEVQALVVHLNPGQEVAQPDGDTDFTGLLDGIARLCSTLSLPLIVKETGFGIPPSRIKALHDAGAAYVDIAGAGGLNWLLVDAVRLDEDEQAFAESFRDWGIPTAVAIDAARDTGAKLIASGGLRSGVDLAKAIALGAELGAMALPLIQDVLNGGIEAVIRRVNIIRKELITVMTLTGSASLDALRKKALMRSAAFIHKVRELLEAEGPA